MFLFMIREFLQKKFQENYLYRYGYPISMQKLNCSEYEPIRKTLHKDINFYKQILFIRGFHTVSEERGDQDEKRRTCISIIYMP